MQSRRAELITKTDMMEAAGVDLTLLEDDYQKLERLDHALWEADFGESMDALCGHLPETSFTPAPRL